VDGERLAGWSEDLSERGVRVRLMGAVPVPAQCRIRISDESGSECEVRATRARCDWTAAGEVEAAFAFAGLDSATHKALVELIFCSDERWSAEGYPPDRVWRSFWDLVTTIWRVLRPRLASRRQSPRLNGSWPAHYGEASCRCLSLSAAGALIELPTGMAPPADGGRFTVELATGRFLDAPVLSSRSVPGKRGQFVLGFDWSGFAPMRDFWMSCLEAPSARAWGRVRGTAWASAGATG
jgi:hypothetical protein